VIPFIATVCAHVAFTIDRVDSRWARVEWFGTTDLSDVETTLFPSAPREGEQWIVHLLPSDEGVRFDENGRALKLPSGTLFIPEGVASPSFTTLDIRMTRLAEHTAQGGASK